MYECSRAHFVDSGKIPKMTQLEPEQSVPLFLPTTRIALGFHPGITVAHVL
jgi:hypothetical protein